MPCFMIRRVQISNRVWPSRSVSSSRIVRLVGSASASAPDARSDDDATDGALAGGWLRTGDLGYLSDGQLYVTGRAKDTVIVPWNDRAAVEAAVAEFAGELSGDTLESKFLQLEQGGGTEDDALSELLLKARGDWDDIVERYVTERSAPTLEVLR